MLLGQQLLTVKAHGKAGKCGNFGGKLDLKANAQNFTWETVSFLLRKPSAYNEGLLEDSVTSCQKVGGKFGLKDK